MEDFTEMPVEKREKIKLLKGHFDFGLHTYFDDETKYFTFLRQPEERIVSFYFYVKRTKTNRLYKRVELGKMNFKDFINLGDKDSHNGQIRKLSGIDTDEETMLVKARENINDFFPVVGLTELFDESLIVLAHYFSWPLPYYRKLNISRNKKEISEEEKKSLTQKNQGDIKLYKEMKERLERQMKEVPFFKLKLFWLRSINWLISII